MADSTDPFDPYLKWLGIRDPERPPNHYRLLGVELFEADPDVIAAAADRQMAHIRRFQHGAHVELSQQLLNQLATAKVCLLRPDSKSEYDRALGHTIEQARVAAIVEQPVASRRAPRDHRRRPAIGYYLAGIAIAAAAVFVMIWRGESNEGPPEQLASQAASDTPSAPAPSTQLGEEDTPATVDAMQPDQVDRDESIVRPVPMETTEATSVEPLDEVPSEDSEGIRALEPLAPTHRAPQMRRPGEGGRRAVDPRTLAPARPTTPAPAPVPQATQGVDGDESFTFIGWDSGDASGSSPGTFARVRKAMQMRDLDQAETLLEQLRQESSSYSQREAAEQLWLVFFQWKQFWNAVDKGLALMKPGVEMTVAGQGVKVIEARTDEIVFQVGEQRSTMKTDRASIDSGLAMTLATIHYLRQGASPQPTVAAFLAVDRAGDPKLAGEIWREMRNRNMATPLPVR